MRRPLFPSNPSEIIHFSTPPLPFSATTLYYTLPRNRAAQRGRDRTRNQISPSDPPPVADPATDRVRACPLLPPAPAPMGSADRSEIDGVAVAGRGTRGCVECRATTTPMWRSGPTGPRSLCNACGIRYRKKRRQELGLDHKQHQQLRQQHNGEAKTEVKDSSSSSGGGSSNLQAVQKRRLLMGVEEAALLLMTLSSSPTSTLLHG
ncbi:transcription factor stalky-like [Panicum virgatum]|uniref:GATA-type domain-containing protein n=1 Tax=Panicum virgatum TaxID=38727 RepID=A0A8T0SKA6_PANVG|nr:transcription factor stalky-like [Panicum virgatum]KAG2597458.1 hypothetical protein PVAP13_5KG230300 [Panicum virgatum]